MNRKYDREWYLDPHQSDSRIFRIVVLSTDVMPVFAPRRWKTTETLALMEEVKFDMAFMFKYSERREPYAHKHFGDDVGRKKNFAASTESSAA